MKVGIHLRRGARTSSSWTGRRPSERSLPPPVSFYLVRGKGARVRTDGDYRLRRGGRGDGARREDMAHISRHFAALRNQPTDWTLQTNTDIVIGGPPPEAAAGQQWPQKAATNQRSDVGENTGQGRDGGPVAEREEASNSTHAGQPGTARRNCNFFGEARGRTHFAARQWGWSSTAPTCNQRRDATSAQPAHTPACARRVAEKTRHSYSATQWGALAHVDAGSLTWPPPPGAKTGRNQKDARSLRTC